MTITHTMPQPVVSVVIPAYNRSHLLPATIDSVLTQTFQDFEVIVVDDGSSDTPEDVVRRFADSRIRILRQPNAGANTARNLGIDDARGDFVALLDSDDRFLPHHLHAAVGALRQRLGTVVYGRIVVDRGAGNQFRKPPRALGPREHMADYLLRDRGFVQTSTLVLPTALARKVRYRDGLRFGQDADFAIRLYLTGAKFLMLPEPSAVWRDVADPTRVSSGSTSESFERWLEQIRVNIPAKAYHGGRGWYLAKTHARSGRIGRALRLFLAAFVRGCYTPRMATVILLQLLFSGSTYRHVTDTYISLRKSRSRD